MFCMARIVCHLKFEAIATQSTLRVSGPLQGSQNRFCDKSQFVNPFYVCSALYQCFLS